MSASAAANSVLPSFLQSRLGDLPSSCHPQLVEVYKRFSFSHEAFEAFEVNNGTLIAENIPVFQAFLEKELLAASKAAVGGAASGSSGRAGGAARRSGGSKPQASSLNAALGAALGLPGRSAATAAAPPAAASASAAADDAAASPEKLTTPGPKRPRQEEEDQLEASTPEPPRKQLQGPLRGQVSLKASVNDGIAIKSVGSAAPVKIEVLGDSTLWTGPRDGAFAWMDESLEDRAADRDRRLAEAEAGLIEAVRARHPEIEDLVVGTVGVPSQAEVVLCGRILCEGLEGRLNERSMLLEGSKTAARGARVQLNVSGCPQVAAFPGQLVAVLGRSGTTGTTFHARDFIAGLDLPPASAPVAPSCTSLLHVLVVSGPFCTRDALDYSPLRQALAHAVQSRPQVVLIIGPFVDANNRMIVNGEAILPGMSEEDEPLGFEDVYTEHVLPMLRKGILELKRVSPNSEVLIVPSLDEALSFHPMPQPPLHVGLAGCLPADSLEPLRRLGVQFLPNPAHISVNGLKISITSADALSPVLRSGLVLRPEERKIEQALRLLLQQRSLFPVLPRDPPQVSEARASALDFPEGAPPDVCIFPSASGSASGAFVDGRLFINPGPLCRPAATGTFAELYLAPPASAGAGQGLLSERARVDIKSFAEAAR